jgi:DNA polymerase elongation subunit (family B)
MIHVQALTWDSKDEHGQYMINIFGKTDDGKSVYTKVKYNPKFYVEIPDSWDSSTKESFVSEIRAKLSGQCDVVGCGSMPYCSMKNKKCNGDACYSCKSKIRNQLRRCKHYLGNYIERKCKKFYGFTNDAEFNFLELVFTNKASYTKMMYAIRRLRVTENEHGTKFDWFPRENLSAMLQTEYENLEAAEEDKKADIMKNIESIKQKIKDDTSYGLEQYESNFDPMLKFCHSKHAPPAGWFSVSSAEPVSGGQKDSYCDIELHVSHNQVSKYENEKIAPFVIASFDIETYSPANRSRTCDTS